MYYSAKVKIEKCNGCKLCIVTCPDSNVIGLDSESKKVCIEESRCKGCGLCVTICPKDALEIE